MTRWNKKGVRGSSAGVDLAPQQQLQPLCSSPKTSPPLPHLRKKPGPVERGGGERGDNIRAWNGFQKAGNFAKDSSESLPFLAITYHQATKEVHVYAECWLVNPLQADRLLPTTTTTKHNRQNPSTTPATPATGGGAVGCTKNPSQPKSSHPSSLFLPHPRSSDTPPSIPFPLSLTDSGS